jgi:hypothetical protein
MFPNVRLMIVAMSASLLAIVCAMGLFMGMFAAFNVTHQPFSAPAAGRLPLQIAFADESSAPVADGKPAPFGVRFQVNARQVPNGPVIVVVPAALDRASQDAPVESAASAEPDPESGSAKLQDGAVQSPSHDAQTDNAVQNTGAGDTRTNQAKPGDAKANDAKSDDVKADNIRAGDANKNDVTASVTAPAQPQVSERPTVLVAPQQHIAPEIRIVAREADNPASVSTSPAPTLAHKAIKRRKLAARLHQLHHFRRPRIHSIASNQASVYAQPNGYGQANGYSQPNVNAFPQPNAYAPANAFAQPGLQFTPAAIKPRPVKLRHAARNANGNSASQ